MMTREKLIHHIETLRERHEELDQKIQELYSHHTDDFKVEDLKKKKLKIKDDIELSLTRLKKIN